jgi:SNF2 family DNA or RNA helicase
MRIVDDKAIILSTANPKLILDNIKKSALIERRGGEAKVAVYWGQREVEALTALKVAPDIPSPILRDYEWTGKYTPFEHQKTTASFLTTHKKAFCFSQQGTGKTASVIWAADYLMKKGLARRVLVVCPLSIIKAAWQQDLFTFAMHRSCSVAHGSADQRRKAIASGAEFVIINFDGLAVVRDEIAAGGFDIVVIDEATSYKNVQTARWKVLHGLLQKSDPRLWMLTGTPAAQSPVDAYGLAKLVNPDGCPKWFGEFRANVMYKVTQFKWAPKPHAAQYVHTILQPAIRFEKKDCLDLPEVTFVDRDAPLTPQQAKYYKQLKQEMTFMADGERITAVNAAVNINKLLQISGGAIYSDDKEIIEFDVSNRIKVVMEAIEESSNKVLVFVPFTHTIELLETALKKRGISCGVINGKVPLNKRSELVETFQRAKDPRVLVIQPQAAAHGLTLTAADTIIWYAPVTSVETYLQANARIDRPGQKHPMTIIHITGSEVERRLYSMLRGNIATHEKLIDLYRDMLGVDLSA